MTDRRDYPIVVAMEIICHPIMGRTEQSSPWIHAAVRVRLRPNEPEPTHGQDDDVVRGRAVSRVSWASQPAPMPQIREFGIWAIAISPFSRNSRATMPRARRHDPESGTTLIAVAEAALPQTRTALTSRCVLSLLRSDPDSWWGERKCVENARQSRGRMPECSVPRVRDEHGRRRHRWPIPRRQVQTSPHSPAISVGFESRVESSTTVPTLHGALVRHGGRASERHGIAHRGDHDWAFHRGSTTHAAW